MLPHLPPPLLTTPSSTFLPHFLQQPISCWRLIRTHSPKDIFNDKELSDKQFERRKRDNKEKVSTKTNTNNVNYKIGELIFVKSDKDKH